ncbi:MAG: CHAT domain-containing protein [Acidobacteriota bacterium]
MPRGHQELVLTSAVTALPVFIGAKTLLEACLATPLDVDTSQWEVQWQVDGQPSQTFRRATVRSGQAACFAMGATDGLSAGRHRYCGDVRDAFDQRAVGRGCIDLEFRPTDPAFDALTAERSSIMRAGDQSSVDQTTAALLELSNRAEQSGYPLSAFKARAISSYKLRRSGTPEALQQASELLDRHVAWLEAPASASAAATLAYERASLALERFGDDRRAWRELRIAEDRYAQVADPAFVTVALKQADIQSRAGATQEARQRLEAALSRCEQGPCRTDLVPAVRTTLAWVVLLDPDALPADLHSAEKMLEAAIDSGSPASDLVEQANVLTNLAYARARQGGDYIGSLQRARDLLKDSNARDSARAREVWAWTYLVDGLASLSAGHDQRALAACAQIAQSRSPQLEAWSAGCRARAWLHRGVLDVAATEFAQALSAHMQAAPSRAGTDFSLGLGRRADDFYEAARLELLRGRARAAWELLEKLDALSMRDAVDAEGSVDTTTASNATAPIGRELEAQRRPIASGSRQSRDAAMSDWRDRAQEALRQRSPSRRVSASAGRAIQFRAIALPDEVLLLQQRSNGEVLLHRRTAWPRGRLREAIEAVRASMREAIANDQDWLTLTAPLSAALVPDESALGAVTTFALHGILQAVPLGALPQAGTMQAGNWFMQKTVVAVVPANARAAAPADRTVDATPLFVVDPSANLRESRQLAQHYKRLFAHAALLEGSAATRTAVERAVDAASWLHLDAHAVYDALFPELSTIELADGPVLSADIQEWGRRLQFANLSGCGTGRWHPTADSGRYGIGGQLVRVGVPWAIATLADLPDEVAAAFNRALYDCLSQGSTIPVCFGTALRSVAQQHRAAAWAGVTLIHASEPFPEENAGPLTPLDRANKQGAQR